MIGRLKFEGEYLYGYRTKGKELDRFDSNKVLFEGEYLNEKRNGNGKEYNKNGELIFEGEYLYGYRFKGKEYIKGLVSYEGEYLFKKKWNGKGYDKNGNQIYELRNGFGNVKEFNENWILIFEGKYYNGKRNGKGKEYSDSNGILIYEGNYLNGERSGKGKEYNPINGSFEGEVKYSNGTKDEKCFIF